MRETGRGFPDAAYLQPLSLALGISITEIVNGELTQPERAAKQADDALLSALEYAKRMRRTVLSVLLAIAGVACLLSPLYVIGADAYMLVVAAFLIAGAMALQFWRKGISAKSGRILAAAALLMALVLQALPISAVLVFKGPTYYNRNLYSCFDPMLVGYANFGPGLSAVLTAVTLVLLSVLLLGKRNGLRNGVFVCTVVSGVFMLVPPVLMGGEYMTPAALVVVLLQLWKGNPLISILSGTALYMLMVQNGF